ncbi:MAG: septum formation initiator family protein [Acidaminococcaceae bacterium]|nr:septum formation initiator family protein [Acidaminococcaceae bacterium]
MSRRKQKRSGKLFFGFLFLLTAVLGANVVRQECEIRNVEAEKFAVQQRIVALKEEKAALEKERRLLDDPHYIEKLARENYNMVGKNEIPLFIVDEKTK